MRNFRNILLSNFLLLLNIVIYSQNVGINSSGVNPNASAMLDIVANDKGLLIPRISLTGTNDILTIPSPATSLLIYNTATFSDVSPGYYYWNGTEWNRFTIDNETWGVRGNSGTSSAIDFLGTTDNQPLTIRINNSSKVRIESNGTIAILNTGKSIFIGEGAGINDDLTNNYNVLVGYQAGNVNTSGRNNTAIGYRSLHSNTTGYQNTAIGTNSLLSNSTGIWNTANGANSLFSNTTGNYNTALGYQSLYSNTTGTNNTASGYNCLYSNTVASNNTAFGDRSLYLNTTGHSNTAIGAGVLRSNVTGFYNVGCGANSLHNNTVGNKNTATGYQALQANTGGVNNSAFGFQSLVFNTLGNNNTALGVKSLRLNLIGNNNTALGSGSLHSNQGDGNTAGGINSLYSNNTGIYNTAFGLNSLNANTIGSYNTAIGFAAIALGNNYTNASGIGYNSAPSASNTVRIGNNAVSTIGGFVNWTNVSDERFKTNIKDDIIGIEFIVKLRPVSYNMDMDAIALFYNTPDSLRLKESEMLKAAEIQTGFIAQEVEQAAIELGFDFHGIDKPKHDQDHYGLRYAEFVVPLVKATQEQQEFIEVLENENILQKNQLILMQQQIDELKLIIKKLK